MSTSNAPTPTPARSSRKRKAIGVIIGILALTLAIAFSLTWTTFHSTAEGLATGYLQAASSAYQMGRPIPDTIFETGLYRVQVDSQGGSGSTPMVITVHVKDRIFNRTFYEESRSVGPPVGKP